MKTMKGSRKLVETRRLVRGGNTVAGRKVATKTKSPFAEENRAAQSEIKRLSVKKAIAMLEALLRNAGQWKK